jgi:hypothetical protein
VSTARTPVDWTRVRDEHVPQRRKVALQSESALAHLRLPAVVPEAVLEHAPAHGTERNSSESDGQTDTHLEDAPVGPRRERDSDSSDVALMHSRRPASAPTLTRGRHRPKQALRCALPRRALHGEQRRRESPRLSLSLSGFRVGQLDPI